MNRIFLRRLFALCLALMLAVPALALAEEETLLVEAAEASEEVVEAAEGLLGEIEQTPEETYEEASGETFEGPAAVQNDVPSTLRLGVKQKYTLELQPVNSGKKITYKSNKKSVATVSSKGVITARKKGTAKITCYQGKTKLATCTVKVVAAPEKVSLDVSSVTIGAKETLQLTPTITRGSLATFTWSSSKKSVATVSSEGVVKGKKAGTAKITVKTQNGKRATVKVKVKKAPGSVSLNKTSKTLEIGGALQLKVKLPSGTASRQRAWVSSNEYVATVSDSGKVTAVGAGTATITVSTFNNKTATCAIKVRGKDDVPEDPTVKYRALLIGEENFSWIEPAPRNRGDVSLMANMLGSVRGLYGGSFEITRRYDLSTLEILDAIADTFADADENDVSLFFIATHGDVDSTGKTAGALSTYPDDMLLLSDLANALSAVPGKVIVALESCGAGAAVYSNGGAPSSQARDFGKAATQAFAAVDRGMVVEVRGGDMNSSGVVSNTGEFRLENKFYVLAASDYQELSWGTSSHNFFTRWLVEGIGSSGSMPADTNYNGQITLNELYKYISRVGDNYGMNPGDGEIYYQHVQVYPSGSSYVLFIR